MIVWALVVYNLHTNLPMSNPSRHELFTDRSECYEHAQRVFKYGVGAAPTDQTEAVRLQDAYGVCRPITTED